MKIRTSKQKEHRQEKEKGEKIRGKRCHLSNNRGFEMATKLNFR